MGHLYGCGMDHVQFQLELEERFSQYDALEKAVSGGFLDQLFKALSQPLFIDVIGFFDAHALDDPVEHKFEIIDDVRDLLDLPSFLDFLLLFLC